MADKKQQLRIAMIMLVMAVVLIVGGLTKL